MHQSIDWFFWLSKTGLEPSLIYEYGIVFSRNELEEEDIAYLNHEFLQSMGISIAKHRLEILKLARKQKGSSTSSHPISKLIIAIKKTKRTLASYIRAWSNRDESSLVVVRKSSYGSYGSRWKGNMLRRSRRLVTLKQGTSTTTLLLTNGHDHMSKSRKFESFSSPVYDLDQEKKDDSHHASFDKEEGGGVKEIRWDTMFENLKPT